MSTTSRRNACLFAACCLSLALAVVCCKGKETDARQLLAGEDVVLAKVNDTPITEYEVGAAARRALGQGAASSLDEAGRRKVTESLVQSRVLSQLAFTELSEAERAEIDKRVAAYREEQLVLAYLERHSKPTPVTGQMVREYYASHPERFGGTKIVSYEMVASVEAPSGEQREKLLAALQGLGKQTDWAAVASKLSGAGQQVSYRRGDVSETTLDPQLRRAFQGLPVGQASSVIMLGGRMHVARIVEAHVEGAKPLEEVADQIRRALAPTRTAEAIKGVSKAAMTKARVTYASNEGASGS